MSLTSPDISTWDPNPNRNALADATKAQDAFFDPFNKGGVGTCVQDVNGAAAQILDATTGAPTGLTLPLAGTSRPKIFNRPMIAFDTSGLLNVYLGTGDTEHPNDPLGTWDYFYGLQDTGSGCARPLFILRFAQNEKMLSDPAFLDGVIFGTTYTPPSGANVCTDAGHGFLYAWDAFTGQPVKAINDPFNVGVKVSKLDLSTNPQLGGSGIPSGPIVRNGKIYVSVETDPSHPRVIDSAAVPSTVKVKGWQRVK